LSHLNHLQTSKLIFQFLTRIVGVVISISVRTGSRNCKLLLWLTLLFNELIWQLSPIFLNTVFQGTIQKQTSDAERKQKPNNDKFSWISRTAFNNRGSQRRQLYNFIYDSQSLRIVFINSFRRNNIDDSFSPNEIHAGLLNNGS